MFAGVLLSGQSFADNAVEDAAPVALRQSTALLSDKSFADNTEVGKQPGTVVTAAIPDSKASSSENVKPAFAPNQDEYVLGSQDLLEIQVFQSDALSKTVRVNSRGIISLPLIGPIQAGGRTSQELEAEIAARLSETLMQDPQVSVFIKEYTSQRVTIEGYVKNAGIYPLKGRTTLVQAVAMASGLDSLADAAEIRVFRNVNGEKSSLLYNLESIRNGETEDPVVKGDDVIVVEKSSSKSILKNVTDTLRGFISFGTL
jgi:polysaccharide export outer membrane protein